MPAGTEGCWVTVPPALRADLAIVTTTGTGAAPAPPPPGEEEQAVKTEPGLDPWLALVVVVVSFVPTWTTVLDSEPSFILTWLPNMCMPGVVAGLGAPAGCGGGAEEGGI